MGTDPSLRGGEMRRVRMNNNIRARKFRVGRITMRCTAKNATPRQASHIATGNRTEFVILMFSVTKECCSYCHIPIAYATFGTTGTTE